MKKKTVSRLIFKISEGVVSRAVDIVLLGVFYFAETHPLAKGSLQQQINRIGRDLEVTNYETLKRAFFAACQKGWLNKKLEITSEGQKRLDAILPQYFKKKKEWSGKWYVVSYDVPEQKRHFRNILRGRLEKLGFAQLHKSVWVSPNNFLGDIEEIIEKYHLSSFVILAVSDRLGREPSMDLAERIWRISEIGDQYKKFVAEAKEGKLSKREIVFKYVSILSIDPQLPLELLPPNWQGEEAYKIYKDASKKTKIKKR
jgi:phenylacetic acid degradation operon negative regulatory protein